jgi:ribosomal protein L11 methyltransferase
VVPERWLTLEVESRGTIPADLIAAVLLEFGARGVVESPGSLTTYVEPPEDVDALVGRLRDRLKEMTPPSDEPPAVSWSWQAQEDWAEVWKQGLHPRRVTPRIIVGPSWEPVEPGLGEVFIVVDPGMAFGTAEHATTRRFLRLLDPLVAQGQSLIDLGAGSGILGIAAVRLGAAAVFAVESDPYACEAARENAQQNGVADRVTVEERAATGSWLASLGPWDGAVANIETGFLLPLVPGLAESVRPGGWTILSGILLSERDRVLPMAEASGLRFLSEDTEGDWWSGSFIRSSI